MKVGELTSNLENLIAGIAQEFTNSPNIDGAKNTKVVIPENITATLPLPILKLNKPREQIAGGDDDPLLANLEQDPHIKTDSVGNPFKGDIAERYSVHILSEDISRLNIFSTNFTSISLPLQAWLSTGTIIETFSNAIREYKNSLEEFIATYLHEYTDFFTKILDIQSYSNANTAELSEFKNEIREKLPQINKSIEDLRETFYKDQLKSIQEGLSAFKESVVFTRKLGILLDSKLSVFSETSEPLIEDIVTTKLKDFFRENRELENFIDETNIKDSQNTSFKKIFTDLILMLYKTRYQNPLVPGQINLTEYKKTLARINLVRLWLETVLVINSTTGVDFSITMLNYVYSTFSEILEKKIKTKDEFIEHINSLSKDDKEIHMFFREFRDPELTKTLITDDIFSIWQTILSEFFSKILTLKSRYENDGVPEGKGTMETGLE